MDDYLRNVQYWLRTVDAIWDAGTDTESSPVIPSPRAPLE